METVNIKTVQLDLKNPKLTTIGDFIQNDTNIIKFAVVKDGSLIDLDVLDQILINYQKPSGEIISRIATAENDVITYQLGTSEMSEHGLGKLVIQFFKSDNRISTFTVNVNIKQSIEANFSFEETQKGLVDQVMQELNLVNTRIDNIAFDGVDTSKIATKEDLRALATKSELSGLATKTELSERVKTINGLSPDSSGNININPGTGTTPGNVLLFEDWTPGESVIIGDGGTPTPPPPTNTAPSVSSSFNTTSVLTTTSISIPYSVTDAQGGNLTATYTKNGTTTTATVQTGANIWNVGTLTVGSNTLKIKVTDSGGLVSNELTFTITATQPTETDTTPPILTVTPAATFTNAQTVTMSANEAATIYYTLDGTTPTQTSPVYTTPLTLSATTTVKAFAKDTAGNVSAVQTIVYTKTEAPANGILFKDTFNRANNATELGVSDSGHTWTSFVAANGTTLYGIKDNSFYYAGGTDTRTIPYRRMTYKTINTNNFAIEVTFPANTASAGIHNVGIRMTPNSTLNFICLETEFKTSSRYLLKKNSPGVSGNQTIATSTKIPSKSDKVTIKNYSSGLIEVFINDILEFSVTDDYLLTSPINVGLGVDVDCYFDSIEIKEL